MDTGVWTCESTSMAELRPGRRRPGRAVRRGLWALLLGPAVIVALPGIAAADPEPRDPQYPPQPCVTTQALHASPDTIDDASLPKTVTVTGTGFPSAATVDAQAFVPVPGFGVTILLDGTKVATAQGESFSVPVTIPQGVPSTVTISAQSDDFSACRASTVIRLGCLERTCLPVTGSDTGDALWLGLTTLALGAILAVGARRRSHARPPERRQAAVAGGGIVPVPARRIDAVLSAFAPRRSSEPAPAAVLDRFEVDRQLSLLPSGPPEAPAPTGPPDPPSARMERAVQQLRALCAGLGPDD